MKTANIIDSYFSLLKSLSVDNKFELIAKMSRTMKTTNKKNDHSWKSLFGAWEPDQSAETLVEELKSERKFRPKTIDL